MWVLRMAVFFRMPKEDMKTITSKFLESCPSDALKLFLSDVYPKWSRPALAALCNLGTDFDAIPDDEYDLLCSMRPQGQRRTADTLIRSFREVSLRERIFTMQSRELLIPERHEATCSPQNHVDECVSWWQIFINTFFAKAWTAKVPLREGSVISWFRMKAQIRGVNPGCRAATIERLESSDIFQKELVRFLDLAILFHCSPVVGEVLDW